MLQKFFQTEEEANTEVRRGNAWGSLVFDKNYTNALNERVESGRYADNATIDASDVNVRLDMSSE